ncbi:hypothetical protein CORC01_01707 [Colletotrichum orchidophilum]|uniref:Cas1 appressorium specific protein n=1 Tax=Colletotrichum orchidophilum TaxID=1209926 RepID=A0A1G4BNB8_9PEZI|nr:uncharacterized protein CORC01_01707 [Colletotrichum orchidophilum]OHF02949.1 hypothetical protein CORC01_01707 [Colletotrichum orchidophilum]
MVSKTILFALAAAPFVAAHGKVASVVGDLGGNGTALAIQGGVVPGPGPNRKTELDTTVFKSKNIMTDGMGKTTGGGKVQAADITQAMALSGDTLPQVSSTGGNITGVFHVVTTDGAGPLRAVLDTTGTGQFAQGTELQVLQQVPGKGGNIRPNGQVPGGRRSLWERAMSVIEKRASNVNMDFPMAFAVPAGTACTGSMGGQENVCLVKIANSNGAGPFGGVVPIQIAANGAATPAATPAAKREVEFKA